MKIKTSELEGTALDYAVAVCEGCDLSYMILINQGLDGYPYSSSWSQAGPIIEREKMDIGYTIDGKCFADKFSEGLNKTTMNGDTYLQSAMRCYVASKLGDEVEVPEEVVR